MRKVQDMELQFETHRIFLTDDTGKTVAEITFPEIAPGVVDINHTFVDGSLRGKGVAGRLAAAAVKLIRANGWKMKASCSYAAGWLEKHPAEKDLLAE